MVARDQLRAFVERVERIEESIKDLNSDKSEIYAEAKGCGFDVPTIKKVVRLRKLDANERLEADALLDTYLAALGMVPATRAPAQGSEEFDSETGEVPDTSSALVGTVAAAMQTEIGRRVLTSAIDVMIEREEATEPSQAHTEVGSEQAAASAPLGAAADHSEPQRSLAAQMPPEQSVQTDPLSDGADTSLAGAEGIADRQPQPETAASPVALTIYHDESREARSLRLRPNCQNPSACAGVGTTHCYSCKRVITSMNGGDGA